MTKKREEEFQSILDTVVDAFVASKAESPALDEFRPVVMNLFKLLSTLERQVREGRDELRHIEERMVRVEKEFKLLIKELRNLGYISKLSERRKPLKRNMLTLEALLNIIHEKGIITKKEFRQEILRLAHKEKEEG
jgi:hypothetical protein